MEKTPEEIANLKRVWQIDPCWDLEETEGFEDYKDELKRYREHCELNWERIRIQKLQKKADELGVSGNLNLARHVISLEERIDRLEQKILKLSDR